MTSHFRLVYYNIVMCLTVTFLLSCVNIVNVLITLPNMSLLYVCYMHLYIYVSFNAFIRKKDIYYYLTL